MNVGTYEWGGGIANTETFDPILVTMQRLDDSIMCHSLAPCQVKLVKTGQILRNFF